MSTVSPTPEIQLFLLASFSFIVPFTNTVSIKFTSIGKGCTIVCSILELTSSFPSSVAFEDKCTSNPFSPPSNCTLLSPLLLLANMTRISPNIFNFSPFVASIPTDAFLQFTFRDIVFNGFQKRCTLCSERKCPCTGSIMVVRIPHPFICGIWSLGSNNTLQIVEDNIERMTPRLSGADGDSPGKR